MRSLKEIEKDADKLREKVDQFEREYEKKLDEYFGVNKK